MSWSAIVSANATRDLAPQVPATPPKPVAGLSTEDSGVRNREFYRHIAELIAQAADALEHAVGGNSCRGFC